MSLFHQEIAQALTLIRGFGGDVYSIPWYLVVGEPQVGKSTVIRSMNLTFASPPNVDGPYCQIWVSKEAVLIEARDQLTGPNRNPDLYKTLMQALIAVRPREPLDGMLVCLSATDLVEREEEALEAYAQNHRAYLLAPCGELQADIPVYVVVNRYDTLWGFAEVFSWNAERAKEEPWGFLVPPDVPSQTAWPKIAEGAIGFGTRVEATCLQKLSSDDGIEQRIRAFQHLAESRIFVERLRDVLKVISFSSAYERAPWLRATVIGCAVPGVGDRLRAGVVRFANMGLMQNPYDPHRSPRPGGLPVHAFMKGVVIPEKELVPLKVRFRDDRVFVVGIVVGLVLLLLGLIVRFALV